MAVSNCFTCGKGFSGDTNALLMLYKKEYETKKIDRYFYKTETNGTIRIIRAKNFKTILETEIKPNFDKGSEYAHISEFKGI